MREKAQRLYSGTEIDWNFFEETLHRKFNVNAVTFDKNGARKTGGDVKWANGLCRMIKGNPNGASQICAVAQNNMSREAGLKRECITEECDAGMYKIVIPIIKDDEIDGYVSACGRPFYNIDRIDAFYIHKVTGKDEKEVKELLSTVNPIDPRTISDIKEHITSYHPVSFKFTPPALRVQNLPAFALS
ncbi:MAG: hypothetical protein GY859_22495 [Desulfobacterales bacterium]|nr:hypothetical protein [Desulfobacterales bacterium]